MCNLLVDMGNLTTTESLNESFKDSVNKQKKLGELEQARVSQESEHEHEEKEVETAEEMARSPSGSLGVRSQSVSNIIKARLEEEEKNKKLWRVSVVQFLAAVHSEENLHNWFSRPRSLYNKLNQWTKFEKFVWTKEP